MSKLQFSDKKVNPMKKSYTSPFNYSKDDFLLDFSTAYSGGSTTDNILSDEEVKTSKVRAPQKKNLNKESNSHIIQDQTRQSESWRKFYCYLPQMLPLESKKQDLNEIDELSSESSLDQSEDNEMFEQYL